MGNKQPTRKARFRAALALAEMTVEQFCREQSVTRQHLYATLREDRDSLRLTTAVDAFIAKHVPRQIVAA